MAHEHPSFFELDQLALSPGDERLARLQGCPQCLAYVSEQQRDLPVPQWAREAASSRRGAGSQRLRWLVWALSGALAASVVFIVVRDRDPESIREKGAPAVALFVKHEGAVARWDGHAPVSPGDSLMLEVTGAGFRFVTVESLSGAAPAILYRGELKTAARTLLPQSYRVDAAPGPEKLRIVFSNGDTISSDDKSWPVELAIPKQLGPPGR